MFFCGSYGLAGLLRASSSESSLKVGPILHPVMDITREYCRYIKTLLALHVRAISGGGIDLI